MQGINTVILAGRLGKDPEIRQTAQGKAVCKIGVATSRNRRTADGWMEETDWHDVVLWEEQAERAGRLLGRGDLCSFEGRLAPRSWEDAQGQRRRTVEVVARRFQLIKSARHRREQQAPPPDATQAARSVAAMPTPPEQPAPF